MSVDNESLLSDRIAKIRAINKQYNLLDNAYISFSGGKDSTILHYLMDEALPGNQIPHLLEPSEYKRAQWLWKTVYDEYRRIGYRLNNQPTLFD